MHFVCRYLIHRPSHFIVENRISHLPSDTQQALELTKKGMFNQSPAYSALDKFEILMF